MFYNTLMQLNWVDWVILVLLLYNAYIGWETGLISLIISLISFAGSLWIALVTNQPFATFLSVKFGIPQIWGAIGGYIVVALVASAVISELLHSVASHLPDKITNSKFDQWLGAVISILNGTVIIAFLLLLILTLPLRGTVKKDIQGSMIGSFIVSVAQHYDAPIQSTMIQMQQAAIKFMTIAPKSDENITLDVSPKASDLYENTADEQQMVILVNKERVAVHDPPLAIDPKLTAVAVEHSRDMFLRHYFSHVTPERKDPGDRLTEAKIPFSVAGENIAYAPDLATAHSGLMNSPEHKKNILDPSFNKVGIGIISTATLGSMYTQDFTN